MSEFGKLLLILGLGSFLLNSIGAEFRLLMWIDNWGPVVGHCIRGGFVVVGTVFLFLGKDASTETAVEDSFEDVQAPA